MGEDVFVLACWKDARRVFCLYEGNTSKARLYSNPNPLPKTSMIDLVVRKARLRIHCLHAFLRPLSFPHAPMLYPPRPCLLRSLLMSVDYNFVARETEPGTAFPLVRHRDPLIHDYARASLLHSIIDLRHGSPPRNCALLAIVHGESAVEVVREWN